MFAAGRLLPGCLILGSLALVVSCASSSESSVSPTPGQLAVAATQNPAPPSPTPTPAPPEATAVPEAEQIEPTASPETTAEATVESVAEPVTEPTTEPEAPEAEDVVSCTTIADFMTIEGNEQWLVVNDDVMGGRSLGGRSFTDSSMVFAGEINTDGGGFASLRLMLAPGALAEADRMHLSGKSDGRVYMMTFDDALDGRNRRVSFRAPLEFVTPGEWETVTVRFADLYPAVFGQQVEAAPFRADLATRIGIMQSDGTDGEFRLEVDHIEACS